MRSSPLNLVALALALALVGGCSESAPTTTSETPSEKAALPAELFAAASLAGAEDIGAAKEHATVGTELTVRGRIGGSKEPFVSGRAALTLVTMEGLTSCKDLGEDHCPTPWDYCCETREQLVRNTLTVQVTGPDGRPLRASLEGVHGLEPLAVVEVHGTVSSRPNADVLVLDADRIHVVGP